MHTKPDVAVCLCQTLTLLARESQFTSKIKELELSVEIVQCVVYNVAVGYVVVEGCNAIGTIAGMSAENRATLVEHDAYGAVVNALYAHEKKSAVAEQSAYALANLSIDLSTSKIQVTAFKAINKLLVLYRGESAVVLWSFIAMTRLCAEDAHMSRLLVAPSSVLDIMQTNHTNAELVTWGLRSILGLLPPPENSSRFLAANVPERIVAVISHHCDNEAIVELVLIIVAFISVDEIIKLQLGTLGICSHVALALQHYRDNEAIAVNGCKAVARLAFGLPDHIDSFIKYDITDILGSVLSLHMESEDVLVNASHAISSIAFSGPAKAKLAANHDILLRILKILRRSSSVGLASACCAVLGKLATDDEACSR
jgi:hypothetical protein